VISDKNIFRDDLNAIFLININNQFVIKIILFTNYNFLNYFSNQQFLIYKLILLTRDHI